MAYQQIDPKDLGPHLAKRSEEHLPSAESEITNEEIRFALKQLGAYFSIKIRDKKEGDVPVELLQQVEKIQEYIGNLPSAKSAIIYCGECKYMMPNGRCSVFADSSIRPSASDYCSNAERRQDVEDSTKELKKVPPVEPELKHGKWIKNEGRHGWHCSECMKDNCYAYAWSSETRSEAGLQEVLQDYYCPNCGAKMDEEVKDE